MLLANIEPGSAVWFWAAAATIIATLASVVAVLYKGQMAAKDTEIKDSRLREESMRAELVAAKDDYKSSITRLEGEIQECRKDREELRVEMARLDTRLSMLEKNEGLKSVKVDKRLDNLEQN